MSQQIDISVCVPTYKRPSMVKQAAETFIFQNYKNSELVIIDDASGDETGDVIKKLVKKDSRIHFEQNKKNMGYCKNFIKTILTARGKYLFLMGDDDLILGKNTLERYVEIFEKNKKLGFVYGNIIQFNNDFNVDYIYKNFAIDTIYHHGREAIENIWLKSSFVGGVGLRNRADLSNLFPKDDVLFPIVEMVGKVLLDKDGLGLASFHLGMRVHADQLGFHMMKKQRVVGRERHASVELYEIYDNLLSYIKKTNKKLNPVIIKNTIDKFLKVADKSTLVSEGSKLDKGVLITSIFERIKEEKRIKHSPLFWLELFAIVILPRSLFLIELIKRLIRKLLRPTLWRKEVEFFEKERERIFLKTSV